MWLMFHKATERLGHAVCVVGWVPESSLCEGFGHAGCFLGSVLGTNLYRRELKKGGQVSSDEAPLTALVNPGHDLESRPELAPAG